MASNAEEELSCPICHDIIKDPSVLSCSHTCCKGCLKSWWKEKKTRECPVCKTISSKVKQPRQVLRNLCESFFLDKDFCLLHSEKLKLFCLDHQEPVCLICRDSQTHTYHRFRPIDEVAKDCREQLKHALMPLQEKLKLFEDVKGMCEQTAEHIKFQVRNTESQIKEQFRKLHQFLQDEEEARLAALKEEKQQKSQIMKEKLENVATDIAGLLAIFRVTDKELKAKDVPFLQNYKAAVEREQQRNLPDDPQLVSGALIDVAKHLGNLGFHIWNKMITVVSYTPVILDPNTAHPELILSDDLTIVTRGTNQNVPENPERFDYCRSVIGSWGFNSGYHRWDVDVGESSAWAVGVADESVQRKGEKWAGLWRIMLYDGKYTARSPTDALTDLPVKTLQKIRIYLDWDGGTLSFMDLDTNTYIHTFTHTFTEMQFPYINTVGEVPVKILSENISLTVEDE
ncbi:nuclear factor 7, ovary-like [Thalassophryne amazonica]|uniref:nuclear factor 7, ovary-like n=1 Tax=Thalassophryne amazonica TaxID=390379 RepID=UPI0014716469|nr:nuclear factor 7, ovary-like [Thalassophryne amazonica]